MQISSEAPIVGLIRSQKISSVQDRVTGGKFIPGTNVAAAPSIVANWIAAKTPGLSYGLGDSVFSAAGNGAKFGNESEF